MGAFFGCAIVFKAQSLELVVPLVFVHAAQRQSDVG